jgi:predicted ArsR family transcriptional regulator
MSSRPFSRIGSLVGRPGTQKAAPIYSIEGEPVTMQQISERLGISKAAARSRWNSASKKTGAVNWAALQPPGRAAASAAP